MCYKCQTDTLGFGVLSGLGQLTRTPHCLPFYLGLNKKAVGEDRSRAERWGPLWQYQVYNWAQLVPQRKGPDNHTLE